MTHCTFWHNSGQNSVTPLTPQDFFSHLLQWQCSSLNFSNSFSCQYLGPLINCNFFFLALKPWTWTSHPLFTFDPFYLLFHLIVALTVTHTPVSSAPSWPSLSSLDPVDPLFYLLPSHLSSPFSPPLPILNPGPMEQSFLLGLPSADMGLIGVITNLWLSILDELLTVHECQHRLSVTWAAPCHGYRGEATGERPQRRGTGLYLIVTNTSPGTVLERKLI